jgi:hypothetical protein
LRVGDHRGDRLIDLMSDRGRQLAHGRDAIGVRERLSFFLRPPAFGHIHQGPHEFDQIAGWADNRVADDVDISDLAARMLNRELSPVRLDVLLTFRAHDQRWAWHIPR